MNKLIVLGTCQDGGYPQSGCTASCCKDVASDSKLISSIAITNDTQDECWIVDASPDIKHQLNIIKKYISKEQFPLISGIFLTHAHIGHYIGLLDLGLEVMNLKNIPVYAMPGMASFLSNNAPFNQLIHNQNIILHTINKNSSIPIDSNCSIKPFNVPHRNELSETVGYKIITKSSSTVYLPDIDSWEDWEVDINDVICENNLIFIDGTFYDKSELKLRDISKVPHPSIVDSTRIFDKLDISLRSKIFFTHFNHTNKILQPNSIERADLISRGYNIPEEGQEIILQTA